MWLATRVPTIPYKQLRSAITSLLLLASPAGAQEYFAHIDSNGVVNEVIVASPDYIRETFPNRVNEWIETYKQPGDGQPKNYAGIGYTWNPGLFCFVPPMPPTQEGFDDATCQWQVPAPLQRPVMK